jgi:hypothetical protein
MSPIRGLAGLKPPVQTTEENDKASDAEPGHPGAEVKVGRLRGEDVDKFAGDGRLVLGAQ